MANILITGAGSGLGAKLAATYASEGNHVYLLGRTKENLEGVKRLITQSRGTADIVLCDLTQPDQVKETMEELLKKVSIDVLINNAGVGYFGSLTELNDEGIEAMLNTNVKGTIYITKYLLPHLLERPSAKIMTIISTAGLRGKVNESVYVASKFAQRGFTESLTKELEQTNVKVTAVYMGGMNTPFWDETDHVDGKKQSFKTPDQVAEMIKEQDDGRSEIFIDQ